VLLQSIVAQAKENQETNEALIEAARDITKYGPFFFSYFI
jgi:hypothetical protein